MGRLVDLTGQRFGRLQVLCREGSNKYKKATWRCKCDCGNEKVVIGSKLLIGETQSCGCYGYERRNEGSRKHQTIHGQKYTRLYDTWNNIKQRCNNPHHISYKYYGGKGIRVCDEWNNDFMTFYKWAFENGYNPQKDEIRKNRLTIDRIDSDKDYCPENCRWATYKEQANNRTNTRFLTYNNETKTISDWAKIFNLNHNSIYRRLNYGWDIEKTLTTPLQIKMRAV